MTVRPRWRLQDRIVRARLEAGLQKQELADRISVNAKTVTNWELGYHRPRRRDLIAIAQVTGVDFDWLTEDDDEPSGTLVSAGANHRVPNGRSVKRAPRPAAMTYHAGRRPGSGRGLRGAA